MKFSNIIKYIYTPYAWVVGSHLTILIFIYQLIGVKFTTTDKLYPFVACCLKFFFKILFIKVDVSFEEEFDTSKSYIFMPNHTSFIDVFLAGAYLPVYVNAIEAESHFKWFVYGKVIAAFEQIPISQKNARSALKSYEIAIERLKNGRSIIVFPEGHRSDDGKVKRFKKIPFNFVKNADVDLAPIGFVGVKNFRAGSKIWLKPCKMKVKFGKIITKEEIKQLTTEELMKKTRDIILDLAEN